MHIIPVLQKVFSKRSDVVPFSRFVLIRSSTSIDLQTWNY